MEIKIPFLKEWDSECWPTRTRTLNVGTKNRCVTNYTIGQYIIAGANLKQSFNSTSIFLKKKSFNKLL